MKAEGATDQEVIAGALAGFTGVFISAAEVRPVLNQIKVEWLVGLFVTGLHLGLLKIGVYIYVPPQVNASPCAPLPTTNRSRHE